MMNNIPLELYQYLYNAVKTLPIHSRENTFVLSTENTQVKKTFMITYIEGLSKKDVKKIRHTKSPYPIHIISPVETAVLSFFYEKNYMSIVYKTYKSIIFSNYKEKRNKEMVLNFPVTKKTFLFFNYNSFIYNTNTKNTFFPAYLACFFNNRAKSLLYNLGFFIVSFYSQVFNIFRDILREYNDGILFLPFTFNSLTTAHTKAEFFNNKYSKSLNEKSIYNKQLFFHSYIYYHSRQKIRQHDIFFLEKKDLFTDFLQTLQGEKKLSLKLYQERYFTYIIQTQLKDIDIYYIKDFLLLCNIEKEKIRLKYNSVKSLEREHDRLVHQQNQKYVKIIFQRMEELPAITPMSAWYQFIKYMIKNKFKHIDTKKKLYEHGKIQKNCVFIYADKITAEKSVIFSYTDTDKNLYTIEVCKRKVYGNNKYKPFLKQIAGIANSTPPQKITELVMNTINLFDYN